jgi:hypothetical protein
MIVLTVHLWKRRGVDDIVIRRVGKHVIHPPEGVGEDLSCLFILGELHVLKTGMMSFGKNPCFKRKSRGKGGDGEEGFIFDDDTVFPLELLSDNITEDAAVFIVKIVFGPFDFFNHSFRDDGKGDDLRMGMFQRGPRCDAVVFEDEDISKTPVTPEIDDPLAVGQQDLLHIF